MGKGYITRRGGVGSAPAPAEDWVRPADWLAMPTVTSSEQKFVGLHAVWPNDANFVSLRCQGDYTIDWGDGTVENFASNVQANHTYTYSAISSSTESVRGYRQVIVTVTPQAGNNFTLLDLQTKHNQSGLVGNYASGWLDIVTSLPNCSASGLFIASSATTVRHRLLERSRLLNIGSQNTFLRLYFECSSLQAVEFPNTSGITNCQLMFSNCRSIKAIPIFDTSNVTNFGSFALGCAALEAGPLLNTDSAVTMETMYSGCTSLKSVPLYNTALCQNTSSMFINCFALTEVPPFNFSVLNNSVGMFFSCTSLRKIPLLNVSLVSNANQMFRLCTSLEQLPAMNFNSVSSAVNFNTIFGDVPSLAKMSATGFNYSFSVANAKLSAAALDEIYTNLPTVVGQTITVTGNWGTASHTPSIATGKGWTVTV